MLCELFQFLPLGGNIAALQEKLILITAKRSKMNVKDCNQSSFLLVLKENPELNRKDCASPWYKLCKVGSTEVQKMVLSVCV